MLTETPWEAGISAKVTSSKTNAYEIQDLAGHNEIMHVVHDFLHGSVKAPPCTQGREKIGLEDQSQCH